MPISRGKVCIKKFVLKMTTVFDIFESWKYVLIPLWGQISLSNIFNSATFYKTASG